MIGRNLLALAVFCITQSGCYEGNPTDVKPPPPVPGSIVFVSNRDEGHGEIYSMWDDGTHVVRLTYNAVEDAAPILSPSGAKIAFRRELSPSNVLVMNADGSSPIGLSPGKRAEWSPDGSKFALTADSLWVLNSDGTGRHYLGVGASYVTWSPDGTKLAYVSTGLGGQAANDIYTIAPDGSGAHRVTTDGATKNSLDWSPDGAKLLYSAAQSVYVMNVDGSELTSPCVGRQGRWSHSGERIVFVTDAYDGNEEIYTARADGTDLKNLSHTSANESDPDWGPRQ